MGNFKHHPLPSPFLVYKRVAVGVWAGRCRGEWVAAKVGECVRWLVRGWCSVCPLSASAHARAYCDAYLGHMRAAVPKRSGANARVEQHRHLQ